jgi:hypothetical protein
MEKLHKDLKRIVMMYWQEEKTHWESLNTPEDHVFLALNNIKCYLIGEEKKANEKSDD